MFSHVRKQSPASRSQEIQKAGARRYRLSKLQVAEVSVVNRAANQHARIVITKAAPQEEDMTKMLSSGAIFGACDYAIKKAQAGEVGAFEFNKFFEDAACASFPLAKSAGAAMAAFMATELGKRMLRIGVGLPTPHEASVMKSRGIGPAIKYDTRISDGGDDDEEDPAATHISPAYKELMALGEKHRRSPEGKGMTVAQSFSHVATETDDGRKLLAQDKTWHDSRMRSMRAQANANAD